MRIDEYLDNEGNIWLCAYLADGTYKHLYLGTLRHECRTSEDVIARRLGDIYEQLAAV